jgi:hypothetical protein
MGKYRMNIVDFNEKFDLETKKEKNIYNTDKATSASEWVRFKTKGVNTIDYPQVSSAIKIKQKGSGNMINNALGYINIGGNNIYQNNSMVGLYTSAYSNSHGTSVIKDNFDKCVNIFSVRKIILPTWENCKDEYLAPNEEHPLYEQFTYDSIIYSLFNNSSQQSSLRQVDYKGKKWDIKNEFFWMSKEEILDLAEENKYDEVYRDARTSDDRFVFKMLFEEGIYEKLNTDAKKVIDMATDLTKKSFEMRELMSESKSEYHLDSWDAGYAQLKLVWKEYFKDEFKEFRTAYKDLESRMRPLVYELGFLRK